MLPKGDQFLNISDHSSEHVAVRNIIAPKFLCFQSLTKFRQRSDAKRFLDTLVSVPRWHIVEGARLRSVREVNIAPHVGANNGTIQRMISLDFGMSSSK